MGLTIMLLLRCRCCCMQVTVLVVLVVINVLATRATEAAALNLAASGGVHSVGALRKLQLAQEVKYYDKSKCTKTAHTDFSKNSNVRCNHGQVACCPSSGQCYADTARVFFCKSKNDDFWCCGV